MTQKGDKRIQVQKLSGVAIKMTLLEQSPPHPTPAGGSLWHQPPTKHSTEILKTEMKKCFWSLSVHFPFCLAAPSEPPGNLRWEQQGSQVSLDWEPVRPLANESEVMGYKVSIYSFFEHKHVSETVVTARVAHEWGIKNPLITISVSLMVFYSSQMLFLKLE